MSLLKKASIITTPTAYAEDYLYSIKPAYALGSELVTNGDFATDSDWSKGSGVTISNGKAVFTNVSNATQGLVQSNVAVIGKTYKITFTISDYNQGAVYVLRPTNLGTGSAVSSNGTFTFTLKAETSSSFILFTVGTTTLSIDNVSVKEITDADFDFDRNSTGTRVNEDYLIEDVPYNIVPQSNQFDTTWTKTNVTLTGGQSGYYNISDAWKIDISSAFAQVEQAVSTSGVQTFSVYAKAGTLNFIRLRVDHTSFSGTYFDLQNGVIGSTVDTTNTSMQNVGGGWYRCSISFVNNITRVRIYPATANNDLTATSGNIFIQNAQLVKGDQPKDYLKTTDRLDIPRIDYTNGEPSILLEPQRTNLVTHSEALTTYWTLQGASLIADNTAVNPTGNTFANKLNSTNTATFRSITRNESTAWDSKTLTMSCFAKKITNDYIFFYNIGSVSGINGLWFNINNGTIGTNGAAWSNAKIENYGNGWYRCSAKITFGTSTNYLYINNSDGDNNTSSTVGSQSYIWGTQIEEGSYATSLIHTSGSAVTRSQDVANNAGNSDLFNNSEGVLYAEIKALANDLSFRVLTISDGSTSNNVGFGYRNNSNVIYTFVQNVINSSSSVTVADITEYHKIAIKYKSGDFAMYIDGREVYTSSSSFTLSGLNELGLDNGATASASFYANAKSVMVFKEALTDLELEKLTGYNNHELYMNYYNRLSYLGLVEEYNVESDINNYIL